MGAARIWAAVIVAVVLVQGAVGISAQGAEATRQNTLIVAKDISDIATPDPSRAYQVSGVFLQFFPYSRLVQQRGPEFSQVLPDLATSWSVNSDSSVYTFKLREAVFSSGNPVTAEDVRFSLLRVKNIKGYGAFLADPIKAVEVVDPKTVRVVLTGPNAAFLAALAANVFGIVDSKVVRAQGGVETPGAETLDKAEQWFFTHSAGSGPYVLRRYTRETEIVLERNERYYGPKPFFGSVIIRHVKDPSTQALMLQKGDADVALDLSINQVEALRGRSGITIHEALGLRTVYLGFKTDVAPWNNAAVRQAAKLAIDYRGITQGLMRGAGIQLATPVPVGVLGMTDALNQQLQPRQDLARARELLASARGGTLRAKLMYEAGISNGVLSNDSLAQKLKSDFARVGITLDLTPLASSLFLAAYRQGKVEAVIGAWDADFIDADNWSYFVSGFINRRLSWESPDAKRIVASAVQTSSTRERTRLYQEYYRLLSAADSPYVGIAQPQIRFATRSSVGNFRYHPLYFFEIDRATRQ